MPPLRGVAGSGWTGMGNKCLDETGATPPLRGVACSGGTGMGNKCGDDTGAMTPLRGVACSGWTGLGNECPDDTCAMTPLRGVPGRASETNAWTTRVRCLRYAVWQDLGGRAWERIAWTTWEANGLHCFWIYAGGFGLVGLLMADMETRLTKGWRLETIIWGDLDTGESGNWSAAVCRGFMCRISGIVTCRMVVQRRPGHGQVFSWHLLRGRWHLWRAESSPFPDGEALRL